MWLYFVGLVLGFQMGKGRERVNTKYYNHTDKIMNLKPSAFTFKDDQANKIHYGFIAQELENEYPEILD